jgi:hypothetical protein
VKLYAWHPTGHGPRSFFVAAPDETAARAAVCAYIAACGQYPTSDRRHLGDYETCRWGAPDEAEWWTLTVLDPLQVDENEND